MLAGGWAAPGRAAPWCGTVAPADRPQAVAGSFVHVVYAFPSEGADRSAQLAPQISADVDEIDAWWRGQDPTRVPRFDVVPFSCGLQADVSAVRLPQTSAQLAPIGGRAAQVAASLAAMRLGSPFGKYLVYYDGPSNDPTVCGQSGLAPFSGPTYAFVYLASCAGVPSAAVAAHELIHALGALPPGAPHPCRNDAGHPCDSMQDILYPFASGQPLLAQLLDVGRDDYYGHVRRLVRRPGLGVAPAPRRAARPAVDRRDGGRHRPEPPARAGMHRDVRRRVGGGLDRRCSKRFRRRGGASFAGAAPAPASAARCR